MYRVGWAKQDIGIEPRGHAMQGYGMWHHRARGQQSALHARAFFLEDESGRSLVFCCLDLGYVTSAMRDGVCARLRAELGDAFREEALVLTCTHTHSGPGGCTHDALYNVVTPGFVPDHVESIVAACTKAILQARESAAPTDVGLVEGALDPAVEVAWNRSLRAYNRNPEATRRRDTETHLAIDRTMRVLSFRRAGELRSLLSLFGVHATCVGNRLYKHDADNKGYAATHAEQALAVAGSPDAVAVFAQATAGDVSPHYHGPGQDARRKQIRGDDEYAYARRNGELQSDHALSLARTGREQPIGGSIDAVLSYVDFSDLKADPRYADGKDDAYTSEPCHGVAFFRGTPVDGRGMPNWLAWVSAKVADRVRKRRLANLERYPPEDRAYYRRLYAAQDPKQILLEAGRRQMLGGAIADLPVPDFVDAGVKELKRQARCGAMRKSALVPSVLPLQIVTVGQIAIVCCPGEFTTTAGSRVVATVADELRGRGIAHVLLCTYSNDYMGYVTTREEYQEQAYEGGHTIFGQWTLAAFQTCFAALARQLCKPEAERDYDRTTRPEPAPADELALRSNLPVPA